MSITECGLDAVKFTKITRQDVGCCFLSLASAFGIF